MQTRAARPGQACPPGQAPQTQASAAAKGTRAGGQESGDPKSSITVLFDILYSLDLLDLEVLVRCRRVSQEWRGALNHALSLLHRVSFPVGVTGEGVKRTIGLVAGRNLQFVGLVRCRELSARDIEEILKLLHATCPGVREVVITGRKTLERATVELLAVYQKCTAEFKYQTSLSPRRCLTKPVARGAQGPVR